MTDELDDLKLRTATDIAAAREAVTCAEAAIEEARSAAMNLAAKVHAAMAALFEASRAIEAMTQSVARYDNASRESVLAALVVTKAVLLDYRSAIVNAKSAFLPPSP